MRISRIFLAILLTFFLFQTSCSKSEGIYQGLATEEDGIIDVVIPEEPEDEKDVGTVIDDTLPQMIDELTPKEKKFVDDLHEGAYDKLSFMVADVKTNTVVKSYLASTPRRLASVTKISTALAALENVNNISVFKVSKMLKNSFNGEASRYLHLAARSIDGTTISTRPYTEKHSCPDPFLEERPLTEVTFNWLKEQLPNDDWTDADLHDGAGCHYDNFMNGRQTLRIIQLADSFGDAYGGKSFEELLSISGKDGTWKHRNKDHKGRILAKTGTLRPNSNLAGYFYAKRNGKMHKYYFAVFVEKKGSSHTQKSRKLIESLMRYWINYYAKKEGADLGPLVN